MGPKRRKLMEYLKHKRMIPAYGILLYSIVLLVIYIIQEPVTKERLLASVLFLSISLFIVLISCYERKRSPESDHKHKGWINALVLLLVAPVSFLMVEIMVGNFNLKMFQLYSMYNVIWYVIIYYLIYSLIRNSKVTVISGILLIYIAGVVNYLVYLFRGNPILPSDLLAWQTGMSVASNYKVSISWGFLLATLVLFVMVALGMKLEKPVKKPSISNRLAVLGTFLVLAGFVINVFFDTGLIASKIRVIDYFAPKYTYIDYGTAFGFVANVKAMETEEPESYSTQEVKELLQNAEEFGEANSIEGDTPNIIVIMNEAYSDLSMLGDFETSLDYRPYTRTLTDNTTHGTLYVSVFGGATSDTEYEFLTGNSMAVLPANCVPYQQYVTDSTDSLATTLKSQGYYNIAIHPYKGSGYKRDMVYPLLGFDEFLSIEDFTDPELIRTYVSDEESYKKIIEEFESKGENAPVFIFNVTMQDHGGYSSEQLFPDDETVRLTQYEGYQTVEQYLSLLRKSDLAFQRLVNYFSNEEEHTVVLMFGDHQPIAYTALYDDLYDEESTNRLKYQVPFLLWANYDIKEDDVDNISANYLSSYLLETAGIQGTAYNSYLWKLYESLPVINDWFCIDSGDHLYSLADASMYSELISQYQKVGYNNALDKRGRLERYFYLE